MMIPSMKGLIGSHASLGTKFFSYGILVLPVVMDVFFLYKAYTSLNSGFFWLYFILAIITPIIGYLFGMFSMI